MFRYMCIRLAASPLQFCTYHIEYIEHFGDSYMGQWFNPLIKCFTNNYWTILIQKSLYNNTAIWSWQSCGNAFLCRRSCGSFHKVCVPILLPWLRNVKQLLVLKSLVILTIPKPSLLRGVKLFSYGFCTLFNNGKIIVFVIYYIISGENVPWIMRLLISH